MRKQNEVVETFEKLNPIVNGLTSDEVFTLAGFCIVELVRKNIGYKNFNDEHKEEIYSEIKKLCLMLEKAVETSYTLSINEK